MLDVGRHLFSLRSFVSNRPESVSRFLSGRRIVVAGVSRSSQQPANVIFRRLRSCGYEVVPVNPNARELEGVDCYPDLASVPGTIDGIVVVTHPDASADIVRQAHSRGLTSIWFHRSFGTGSVSDDAVRLCADLGLVPIVGGCPMMYLQPVDIGHRCFRWWLDLRGRLPT